MINKKDFISYINRLKQLKQIEDNINSAGKELDFFNISMCEHEGLIVDILQTVFDDAENDWVGYFLYELEFGHKYKPGMITDNFGKNIPLQTPSDLYDMLIENMKYKQLKT